MRGPGSMPKPSLPKPSKRWAPTCPAKRSSSPAPDPLSLAVSRAQRTASRCTASGTRGLVPRMRIDRLLVERGLFDSRAKAQAAIAAGRVMVDGTLVTKPSEEAGVDAVLHAEPAHSYVSRGGV